MADIIFKAFFLIFIIPTLGIMAGWKKLQAYMAEGDRKQKFSLFWPYYLLAFLMILLIVLLFAGYQW